MLTRLCLPIIAFIAALALISGCGSEPSYRSVQTNDQLAGHWKSTSVRRGQQSQETTYELFFINNKTFIGAKRTTGKTVSDNGFYSLDVANGTLDLGEVLKADQALIDNEFLQLTTAAPNTEIITLKRDGDAVTPKEFDGVWVCEKIIDNGTARTDIKLTLNFRGANSYDMRIETATDAQIQKGTFTYNSDYCAITFKPSNDAPAPAPATGPGGVKKDTSVSLDGPIVILSEEIRIQTKKGVEYYFRKQ